MPLVRIARRAAPNRKFQVPSFKFQDDPLPPVASGGRQLRRVETRRSTYKVPPGLSRGGRHAQERGQPRRGFAGLALGFNPGSGVRARRWSAHALVLLLLLVT